MNYAARQNKSRENTLMVLEKKLTDVQNTLHAQTLFTDSEQKITDLAQEINSIVEYKTRGVMLRCKANWIYGW